VAAPAKDFAEILNLIIIHASLFIRGDVIVLYFTKYRRTKNVVVKSSLKDRILKTVYCIIVTYNGMQWIDKCIQSLLDSSYKAEIIVIDNGSRDETFLHIKKNYPLVKLIPAEKNLGFGQGNNIGLKMAIRDNADYVFLLNQDACVEKDCITKLVNAHREDPEFGILSPVHLNGTGSDLDDHFLFYLHRSGIKELQQIRMEELLQLNSLINIPFVNAAAWLISLSCLKKTGGFDPIFFHYGEDDNYGQRVLYNGFKIGVFPTATICHDKDRAVSAKPKIEHVIRKDRTEFLTHACNINNNNYMQLMIKRGGRHMMQMAGAFLKLNGRRAVYHLGMVKYIYSSFGKVKKSRTISMNNMIIPHL
jgi:GT2 family glycosyltransferase